MRFSPCLFLCLAAGCGEVILPAVDAGARVVDAQELADAAPLDAPTDARAVDAAPVDAQPSACSGRSYDFPALGPYRGERWLVEDLKVTAEAGGVDAAVVNLDTGLGVDDGELGPGEALRVAFQAEVYGVVIAADADTMVEALLSDGSTRTGTKGVLSTVPIVRVVLASLETQPILGLCTYEGPPSSAAQVRAPAPASLIPRAPW